jgi:hypothetical protein
MATGPFLRLHNFSLFHFLKIYSSYFIVRKLEPWPIIINAVPAYSMAYSPPACNISACACFKVDWHVRETTDVGCAQLFVFWVLAGSLGFRILTLIIIIIAYAVWVLKNVLEFLYTLFKQPKQKPKGHSICRNFFDFEKCTEITIHF